MAKTSKGHIQQLPSGSFRVKVYAGTDPVTGKARLLRQTCPDEAAAYAALSRMLVEAGGGRFPDQQATLGQALGKYLEVERPDSTNLPLFHGLRSSHLRLRTSPRPSIDSCAGIRTRSRPFLPRPRLCPLFIPC
jgi:hypothetical protein